MLTTIKPKRKKKQLALDLYERTHRLPKNKMITAFINELNLPNENTARTHISLAKKALQSKLNIKYKSRKIDYRTTKKGQAMELFNSNKDLTRQGIINLFISQLHMTENSAATHCSQCAQEYTGPKHKAIV